MEDWDESLYQKLEQKARKAEARYADLRRQVMQQEKQRREGRWKKHVWQLFIVGVILAVIESCEEDPTRLINEFSHQISQEIHLPMP